MRAWVSIRRGIIWLPEYGVGAVILTNSDSGSLLRSSFRRRLLEVLFDGQPIATDNLIAFAQRARAGNAERREELGGAIRSPGSCEGGPSVAKPMEGILRLRCATARQIVQKILNRNAVASP